MNFRIALFLLCFSINTFQTRAQMSGTYTIGGASSDFTMISDAIDSIQTVGVSGDITLLIRPGDYTFDQIIMLDVDYPYWIIFQGETHSYDDVVIELSIVQECRYMKFRNMTIHPKTFVPAYHPKGAAIDRSWNIEFDSCLIDGMNDNEYKFGLTMRRATDYQIHNCKFINLEYGVTFNDAGYHGTNMHNGFNRIENNTFIHVDNSILVGGEMMDSLIIQHNYIDSADIGIRLDGWNGWIKQTRVNANKILNSSNYGIEVYNAPNAGPPRPAKVKITNNFVSGGKVWNLSYMVNSILYNGDAISCLCVSNSADAYVLNNSFYGGVRFDNTENVRFYNNILSYPDKIIFIASPDGSDPAYYGNHNVYHRGDQGYAIISDFGTFKGSQLSIYSQVAHVDTNSLDVDPLYYSPLDLHCSNPVVGNQGKRFYWLSEDIDGDSRDPFAPDIGADEFDFTDVNNPYVELHMRLFPNPTTDNFIVQSNNALIKSVDVFSLDGKLILSKSGRSNQLNISMDGFKSGVYVVVVHDTTTISRMLLVKE